MKRIRGFSLIELAIVLVIVTLLIGGLAVPLTVQIQARRIAETNRTLEEAREALVGYAMTHPAASPATNRYLPCPDTDIPPDGRENRVSDTQCDADHGWLPWVDLGTSPKDAWGNRLRYAVVNRFIWRTSGFSASAPLPPPAGFDPLVMCTTHSCPNADVAADVVFVLVSHGPNGWGAHNLNGSTLAAPSGLDELENLDADRTYITRSPTDADAVSGEFDDLAVWLSHSQLIARVCPTGCLPP
jgi:prepilin-type N-terminal cleavage/methylation domain-containing protein